MFRGKDVEEINQLKREGLSILAISNLTGYDRKTIRKYLRGPEARPVYGPRAAPVSKLAPFEPYLRERLQAGVWNRRRTPVLLRRAAAAMLSPQTLFAGESAASGTPVGHRIHVTGRTLYGSQVFGLSLRMPRVTRIGVNPIFKA